MEGVDELAHAAGCNPDGLHQLLGELASKGVFEERGPGRFGLNAPARMLLDPGVQVSLDIENIGGRLAYAWGSLLEYVRTGKAAYASIFGLPFWKDLEAHPAIAKGFDDLIGPLGHGTPGTELKSKGAGSM